MNIKQLLNKPKVIAVVSDVNQGKSMFLYHILEEAKKQHSFSLFYYGLRLDIEGVEAQRIYSVAEMEQIRNSLIVIDELSSLFDLDNRKNKRQIENTLRLINHNNNILILCGVPENFKKFLCGKVDAIFYKKTTIADFINGTTLKQNLLSYKGYERGSEILNLEVNKALFYDGRHYEVIYVPYYQQYDSKKDNVEILQNRKSNIVIHKKEPISSLEKKGFITIVN
jgi:hypothetical protein